ERDDLRHTTQHIIGRNDRLFHEGLGIDGDHVRSDWRDTANAASGHDNRFAFAGISSLRHRYILRERTLGQAEGQRAQRRMIEKMDESLGGGSHDISPEYF